MQLTVWIFQQELLSLFIILPLLLYGVNAVNAQLVCMCVGDMCVVYVYVLFA